MKATEEMQISVFLSNHPGVVADLCSALARADVNIRALNVLDTVDIGTMRMIVSDPEKAKKALADTAVAYVLVPVVSLALPSRTGSFGEVARIMANAGVNIEYVYSSMLPDADRALGIFRVSDVDTALKLDYPD